jgi:hypothetical protein
VALYAPLFHLIPFEEDNVYVLAWSAATPVSRILAVDPFYYPEWRPLAYATVWIEQHAGAPIALHFLVNLGLWIATAWLVYRITRALAASEVAGVLAGVLVLSDARATWTLVAIVERQTSLACIFGLWALWLAMRSSPRLSGRRQAAICVLLTASTLSKEYGAAFTVAMAAYGVFERRRDLWQPAAAAALAYFAVRMVVVGAITQPYCEEMYLFGTARDVCVDVTSPASYPQLAYNAFATLVNLPLLGLLSGAGQPIFAESRLATGLLFSALAVAALIKGPRVMRLIAAAAVANGLLSIMIYRDRNQLAGACALAILAGVGLRPALDALPRALRTALVAAIIGLIAAQAVLARALVIERGAIAAQVDPCRLEIMDRPFVPSFVTTLKRAYGRPDADCRFTQ